MWCEWVGKEPNGCIPMAISADECRRNPYLEDRGLSDDYMADTRHEEVVIHGHIPMMDVCSKRSYCIWVPYKDGKDGEGFCGPQERW